MKTKFTLLLLSMSIAAFCKTWTISNSGTTFTPNTITITEGDSVVFDIEDSHDALEVSQSTWNSNGNTALSGGFQVSYGGGTVLPAKLTVGTHYFVCEPHASLGMKGQIIVQGAAGIVENFAANISVYPNPATDLMMVKANKSLLGSNYFLYDLTGRQVQSGKLVNETTSIDIYQLPAGIYLMQVGDQNKQTFKVLKR